MDARERALGLPPQDEAAHARANVATRPRAAFVTLFTFQTAHLVPAARFLRPGFAPLLRSPQSRGGRAPRDVRVQRHPCGLQMTPQARRLARRLASHDAAISMMTGRSVPIVSQTEIYSDEMALPTAVTEPPPVHPEAGRPRLGRNSSAASRPPRALA